MFIITVEKNLEILREHFGKSQTEMSEMLGISLQRYNHYENGRRKLPVDIAKSISEKFNIPLDALYFENELYAVLNNNDPNKKPA